jgi:hypothetical protein
MVEKVLRRHLLDLTINSKVSLTARICCQRGLDNFVAILQHDVGRNLNGAS